MNALRIKRISIFLLVVLMYVNITDAISQDRWQELETLNQTGNVIAASGNANIFDIAWVGNNKIIAVGGAGLIIKGEKVSNVWQWKRKIVNTNTDFRFQNVCAMNRDPDCVANPANNYNQLESPQHTNYVNIYNRDRKINLYSVAVNDSNHIMIVGDNENGRFIRGSFTLTAPQLLVSKNEGENWVQLMRPSNVNFSTLVNATQDVRDGIARSLGQHFCQAPTPPQTAFIEQNINQQFSGLVLVSVTATSLRDGGWVVCGNINGHGIIIFIPSNPGNNATAFSPGLFNGCAWEVIYYDERDNSGYRSVVAANNNIYCVNRFDVPNVGKINEMNVFGFSGGVWTRVPFTNNADFDPLSVNVDRSNNIICTGAQSGLGLFDPFRASCVKQFSASSGWGADIVPIAANNRWRFGRVPCFVSTNTNKGYMIADFGNMVKLETTSPNTMSFQNVYRSNVHVELAPRERLYCAEASPDGSTLAVGGAFGNLWMMDLNSSGEINTNSIALKSTNNEWLEEIFDMTPVRKMDNTYRVWMAGEKGTVQYLDFNADGSNISRHRAPSFTQNNLYGVQNGIYGMFLQEVPQSIPPIKKLWLVGQNNTIVSGDLSEGDMPVWKQVDYKNIKRVDNNPFNIGTSYQNIHFKSIAFSSDHPCLGYAVAGASRIFKTQDGGGTWTQVDLTASTGGTLYNFYKIIYISNPKSTGGTILTGTGRFVIVGEGVVLLRNVLWGGINGDPCQQTVADTWILKQAGTGNGITLLAPAAAANNDCSRRHLFPVAPAPNANAPQQRAVMSAARFTLRDVTPVFAGTNRILVGVGYVNNARLKENSAPWSNPLATIIVSTNDGNTWTERHPVYREGRWGVGSIEFHSGGGEEKNNAGPMLFGITKYEEATRSRIWTCGSSGYILYSDEGQRSNQQIQTPCATTVTVPIMRWGHFRNPQMNTQTLNTLNTICAVPTSTAQPLLIAAGSMGVVISTTDNNGGLGKGTSEEQNNLSNGEKMLTVSPNPAYGNNGSISVRYSGTNDMNSVSCTVELLDNIGQTLLKQPFVLTGGGANLTTEISTEGLSSGLYYICVRTETSTLCEKVIINK